ncbi:MAG: AEC family transporter [Planctomycetaceae bacterium]|nr:AEC family transporter [Planctomycetaceae bacterium]
MISGSVVFYKIATTCLLIFAGFVARRIRVLPEIAIPVMSKHVLMVATPAYVIFYMPQSISVETLHLYWYYPVVGFVLIAINDLFAYGSARALAKPGELATFRALVGLPNWVFMALAVCEPIFKDDGVRVVLLFNLGITFYVWSFGMTSFRVGGGVVGMLKELFLNIQTISAGIGVALAFLCPWLNGMESLDSDTLASLPWYLGLATPVWESVYLLGCTALPLSIFQIGLLLGAPAKSASEGGDPLSVFTVSVLRLLVAPLLTMAALLLICRLGVGFSQAEFTVAAIIMAMPAAVTVLVVAEVYGGAGRLAAKGILWNSVASLATAPIVTFVAQYIYRWV